MYQIAFTHLSHVGAEFELYFIAFVGVATSYMLMKLLGNLCLCLLYFTVSAFYAECPAKRVYINGTICTKTKFLGLSVKAQNTGSGENSLCWLIITE